MTRAWLVRLLLAWAGWPAGVVPGPLGHLQPETPQTPSPHALPAGGMPPGFEVAAGEAVLATAELLAELGAAMLETFGRIGAELEAAPIQAAAARLVRFRGANGVQWF